MVSKRNTTASIIHHKLLPKACFPQEPPLAFCNDSHKLEFVIYVEAAGSVTTTAAFFLKSLFFNLSARPTGCVLEVATWTSFPAPPRPTWWSTRSVLGRRATSGMESVSLRAVAATPGEPILAAPKFEKVVRK